RGRQPPPLSRRRAPPGGPARAPARGAGGRASLLGGWRGWYVVGLATTTRRAKRPRGAAGRCHGARLRATGADLSRKGKAASGHAPQGKDTGIVKSKGTARLPVLDGQRPIALGERQPSWP